MPITDSIPKTEKQKQLLILLGEAKRRGLEIPNYSSAVKFPTDSRGYFVKFDGTLFNPNDKQEQFVHSTAVFNAFISGRGAGKTTSSAQKALIKISQGESGAILNPKFEDFKISTWPEFRRWCPWNMVIPRQRYRGEESWEPSQPFTLSFLNGATVLCKGLKDPDSARGPNINWLWYDEAGSDPDGLAWQIALASVRVGENIQAWVSTTPKGKQHWVYKFFVKQDIPEDAKEAFEEVSDGREFIEMIYSSIHENKENLNPVFFANILAAYPSGWLRDQEVFGKFIDAGGQFGDRRWFTEREGGILSQPPSIVSGRGRYWDLAASEKKVTGKKKNDPDETVGSLASWQKGGQVTDNNGIVIPIIGRFYLEDQVGGHWKWKQIKKEIVDTARRDGPFVKIYIEQEPASGGINQIEQLKEEIQMELGHHYKVEGHLPKSAGDRIMAANTWFAEAAMGQWSVIYGNWCPAFFDQLDSFDGTDNVHDDRITSVSGVRHCIAPVKLWKKIQFMHLGQTFDATETK